MLPVNARRSALPVCGIRRRQGRVACRAYGEAAIMARCRDGPHQMERPTTREIDNDSGSRPVSSPVPP